jgi:hypothetical protein
LPYNSFSWSECGSETEGGKNCAKCKIEDGDNFGGLNCGQGISACPDSISKLAAWFPSGGCVSFNEMLNQGAQVDIYSGPNDSLIPGSDGTLAKPYIITKGTTSRMHKGRNEYGAIFFKRAVIHPHTTETNEDGKPVMVADVYKVGYCINCGSVTFQGEHFLKQEPKNCKGCCKASERGWPHRAECAGGAQGNIWNCTRFDHCKASTTERHEAFFNECLTQAFDSSGDLKAAFECDKSSDDYGIFSTTLSAY